SHRDRVGVRLARGRDLRAGRDLQAGLPGRAGGRPGRRDGVHADQPAGRRALRRPRSPDPAAMRTSDAEVVAGGLGAAGRAGAERPASRRRVWRRLLGDPGAVAGALILWVVLSAAYLGPMIAPTHYDEQLVARR